MLEAQDRARQARRMVAAVKADILTLAAELVRIDTAAVPPHGCETPAQRHLRDFLTARGVGARLYDTGFLHAASHPYVRRDRRYRGRANLIARIPGTGGGRSLLLSGHVDTVPAGPGRWRHSPLSGALRGGRLYGRGSWDMKGGLAAQFGVLLALARAGVRLPGEVLAESVVDEEWAGGGGTLAARLKGYRADACAIGEGTGLTIYRATRGGHFVDITARAGDPSAYFSREEVVSPAAAMGRLLGWVDEWRARRRQVERGEAYGDFPDPAPVQVLALEANRFDPDTPWAVPLEARVRVYFQFLPHEDQAAVIRRIERSFRSFCRKDPFFRRHPPEWRPIVDPPLLGHELAADHPWTRCLAEAATAVLGRAPAVTAAEYPCDAFLNQGEFGIPTLLFGPCGAGAHNVDEHVTTRSVVQTAEVLLAAALGWCAGPREDGVSCADARGRGTA
ncbi:MAG: M20/M25/M40 family metallo-hydrolase [Gemmatimonadota bacterium]